MYIIQCKEFEQQTYLANKIMDRKLKPKIATIAVHIYGTHLASRTIQQKNDENDRNANE